MGENNRYKVMGEVLDRIAKPECHLTISADRLTMRIGFDDKGPKSDVIVSNNDCNQLGHISTKVIQFSSTVKLDAAKFKIGDDLRFFSAGGALILKVASILIEDKPIAN